MYVITDYKHFLNSVVYFISYTEVFKTIAPLKKRHTFNGLFCRTAWVSWHQKG